MTSCGGMYGTIQSLHSVFIRKYWNIILSLCLYCTLHISKPRRRQDNNNVAQPPPWLARLSSSSSVTAARSSKSPSLNLPLCFFCRPPVSAPCPPPLPRPTLLRRPRRSRYVPPHPVCCRLVDNLKRRKVRRRN